jgi:hypothetical protein
MPTGLSSGFPCSARLANSLKLAVSDKAVKTRLGGGLVLKKIQARIHFQERTLTCKP